MPSKRERPGDRGTGAGADFTSERYAVNSKSEDSDTPDRDQAVDHAGGFRSIGNLADQVVARLPQSAEARTIWWRLRRHHGEQLPAERGVIVINGGVE